ncbi:MAG: YeeE/YedE thiosulfate transporter family protein [Spirochaetia bacterium]|nr:YeeE/YedE thiosulfate transporter family protein [Spirochaetia bacterium]
MKIPQKAKPYFYGAMTGLLLTASAGLTGQFFGTSTTFPRLATGFLDLIGLDLSKTAFYQAKEGNFTSSALPDWQLLFVIGIGIGAFLSSIVSKTFKREALPPMWEAYMGNKKSKRIIFSLAGGALAMLGARIAGGCPSGHGISGMSQLGVSSLIAMIMFFAGGIITARILYRGIRL